MTRLKRVQAFSENINKVINNSIRELDLTYIELIGCLHMKIAALSDQALQEQKDKDKEK